MPRRNPELTRDDVIAAITHAARDVVHAGGSDAAVGVLDTVLKAADAEGYGHAARALAAAIVDELEDAPAAPKQNGSRTPKSAMLFDSPHWRYLNSHVAEVSATDPNVVLITGNPPIYSMGRGGSSSGKLPGSKKIGVYEDGWYFTTYVNLDNRGAGPFDSEEEAIEAHEAEDREDPEWNE